MFKPCLNKICKYKEALLKAKRMLEEAQYKHPENAARYREKAERYLSRLYRDTLGFDN
jgi:F0F1-type ATP synthase membrane subunit b/b'